MAVLSGKKVAFLVTDGFEQVELTEPLDKVRGAGAEAHIVSIKSGKVQGMNHDDKGDTFEVDKTLDEVSADDYNGLVLPGGVINPCLLYTSPSPRDRQKSRMPSSA